MADDAVSNLDEFDLEDPSTLVKVIVPIAAIGATWVVRQVLDSGYKAVTGKRPPHASDRNQSMARVVMWAMTTAAAIAVVNVVVDRMTAPKQVPHEG